MTGWRHPNSEPVSCVWVGDRVYTIYACAFPGGKTAYIWVGGPLGLCASYYRTREDAEAGVFESGEPG